MCDRTIEHPGLLSRVQRYLYVGCIHRVSPLVMTALQICLRFYTKVRRMMLKHYLAEKKIQYWRQNKQKLLSLAARGYRTPVESLGLDPSKFRSVVELGEIDQDGFLLSKAGHVPNVPSVSREHFLARKRFGLRLVAMDGYIGVQKNYRGNKSAFVNEIEAHYHLGLAGCNIPVIMDVDFDKLTLTFSYIRGRVLHDELARRGAVVRDRDIEDNPQLTWLGKRRKARRRIEESRRVLYDVIDSQFADDLLTQLRKVHEARFIWNDIKYGNVIIEEHSGKPYMIDFDWALRYPSLGPTAWRILCERDMRKFDACFGPDGQPAERNVVCYAH